MAKDRNGSIGEEDGDGDEREERRLPSRRNGHKKPKRRKESSSEGTDDDDESTDSDEQKKRKNKKRRSSSRSQRRSSRRRKESESDESDSEYSSTGSESEESEEEARRRRKREKRRRREREEERDRRRRKEREREKRKRKKEKEKDEKKRKKKEKELGKTSAVTNSWGKYGIIRETDMWNKRPEFQAWLAEVKQVNLETLSNWEEKQMFKEFMEDHNTATFPSKKYYNLEAYHRHQMEKEIKKGLKKVPEMERTVFNDEEQRRQELLRERERQKEEQVEALKCSMQSGMAQAMKDQARLREEMAYQYRLGNFEAAAAIQRRLDPDAAM